MSVCTMSSTSCLFSGLLEYVLTSPLPTAVRKASGCRLFRRPCRHFIHLAALYSGQQCMNIRHKRQQMLNLVTRGRDQDDQGYLSAMYPLLMSNVAIHREQHFKAGAFGGVKESA